MDTVSDLHRAVAATLAEKRIGTPVFVRYTAVLDTDAVTKLAALAEVVRGWVGQRLDLVYAPGGSSLVLRFRGGATALIALVRHLPGERTVDLLILGNHGAIYHDGAYTDESGSAPASVRATIARALSSGRPEAVR
jgi:hypothetical protein